MRKNVLFHQSFFKSIPIFGVLLYLMGDYYLSSYASALASNCMVEKCTDRQTQQLDELVIFSRKSAEHCRILNEYIACLNTTARSCHSMLGFHSALTAANQRWKRLQCNTLLSRTQYLHHDKCPFWSEFEGASEQSQHSPIICSIFGRSMHLRKFNGDPELQRCLFDGTRPLIDNRFFIVQLSVNNNSTRFNLFTSFLTEELQRISKPHVDCIDHQKIYEASTVNENSYAIPASFVDGTNEVRINDGFSTKRAVEIVQLNNFLVEIRLHYLHTIIRIRREYNFLNIFVKAPQRLLHSEYDEMPQNQLCLSNTNQRRSINGIKETGICDGRLDFKFKSALSHSKLFQQCILPVYKTNENHFVQRIPIESAIEECSAANLFNDYFDSCVFDLLLINRNDISQRSASIRAIRLARDFELEFSPSTEKTIDEMIEGEGSGFFESQFSGHSEQYKAKAGCCNRQSLIKYEKSDGLRRSLEHECETITSLVASRDHYKGIKLKNEPSTTQTCRQLGINLHWLLIIFGIVVWLQPKLSVFVSSLYFILMQ